MLIVCPSCATSYNVDMASLPMGGRQVRCARCRTSWHAEPARVETFAAPQTTLVSATGASFAGQNSQRDAFGRALVTQPLPAYEPASGETADALTSSAEQAGAAAEFEAQYGIFDADAPSLAPFDEENSASFVEVESVRDSSPASPPDDIESHAARRKRPHVRRTAMRWPFSRLQNAIMVLLVIDAIVVGWRSDIVRLMPQTASFYGLLHLGVNVRGLAFDKVAITVEQHEGVPTLIIGGDIINVAGKPVDVPDLRLAARDAAHEEIYAWTTVPSRRLLQPDDTVSFRSRLASPPPDIHDVLVRFVARGDSGIGGH